MPKSKFDFSGYATKNDLKCTDGRTILKDAFKHQDGATVPLVWQHLHNDPSNVLGHAILENREDGVYCYGVFNDSENAKQAKELVSHGDISSLSIYANQLQEQAKRVIHGAIREVSLVLSGANSGAVIDNLSFAHADGTSTEDETEALIYSNLPLVHATSDDVTVAEVFETLNDDQKTVVYAMLAQALEHGDVKSTEPSEDQNESIEHAEKVATSKDATVEDIFKTMTEEQQQVVYYLIGAALEDADGADTSSTDTTAKHSNIEGENNMKKNIFDQGSQETSSKSLTHAQLTAIVTDAKKFGSLKESFIAHAEDYGFNPIDVLFPEAKDVNGGAPATIQRDMTWVDDVLGGVNKTPFARIRTRFADITADEARAKGYVTGSLKKDEVITLMKRSTTPTTIYKKQKLDRDDMVDITDFDVVVWLKAEMRTMLNEELARAILISDGRSVADEDKINEQNIRPIAMDDPSVFVHRVQVDNDEAVDNIIDEIIRARKNYKGSGNPAFYVGTDLLTDMLLLKDQFGHRLYKTNEELASVLRVSKIVEVEAMNTAVRVSGDDEFGILGIIVNLKDYTVGADKGGQVAMFDDFDIDYNQYKYLIESRCSGALTMYKSAIVIEKLPLGN
jgi:rRNA maturation endonuclease Nob1